MATAAKTPAWFEYEAQWAGVLGAVESMLGIAPVSVRVLEDLEASDKQKEQPPLSPSKS